MPVLKVIRHAKTGLYLTARGTWTRVVENAWPAPGILEARARARDLKLTDVELCYMVDAPKSQDDCDLKVPISPDHNGSEN